MNAQVLRSDCSSGWKENFFLGPRAGRDGTGRVSFLFFRLCSFLFKKKLLCLEKLVTLIFSTAFPSCDDFGKDNL